MLEKFFEQSFATGVAERCLDFSLLATSCDY
jgi:hypothetical protein